MAKRMKWGRPSGSSARSLRSRERQVRDCAGAARPGMRFRARSGTKAPFSCTRPETTEMMTLSRGIRGDAGVPMQMAARAAAATRILAVMPAHPWAGPAASVSDARVSAAPSPVPMPSPAVPPPVTGPAEAPVPSDRNPKRAPPDGNLRQATELTPHKDRT